MATPPSASARRLDFWRDVAGDLRVAMRGLARTPVFSLVVVGVLTLGIGLNATVFTILKSVALSPMAGVADAARLVVVSRELTPGRPQRLSYPDYRYLRDHEEVFTGLMGSAALTVGLGRGAGSRSIAGELVTGNYFQVLGVQAQSGRTLLPSDETTPGGSPVVVLSDGLWRRDFAANPAVVGNTVSLNGYALTVVGVADREFHGSSWGADSEVFIPVTMAANLGVTSTFFPQGYLRPGMTPTRAAAQLGGLWAALAGERPPSEATEQLRVESLWRSPTSNQSFMLPTLTLLGAMGLLVLAIACANIAGLVLVRGVSRRGEIAVRLALGASRARIVRLIVIENLILALPAAVLGTGLASRGLLLLVGYIDWLAAPQRGFFNFHTDGLVIGFAVLIATGCALLFGLTSALRSSRVPLASVIGQAATARVTARGRLRSGLVIAQVAVSLLLLVISGLMTRSLEAARRAYPGFDAEHVTAVSVDVRQGGYDETRGRLFYRRLLETTRATAGTETATLALYNPMAFADTPSQPVAIDGYEPRPGERLAFMSNTVASDYFRTLRIPIVAGRAFDDRDDVAGSPVAIVNATLAERFWGDAAGALGKRIRSGDGDWRTIVGVAADLKYAGVGDARRPYLYLPFLQAYRPGMILHTRGLAPVDRLVEHARAAIGALDANLPILYARPLTERISIALFFLNWGAMMLFVFGTSGIALAALGTYGLVSYVVQQSVQEIGIRMALGASGGAVVRRFLARGAWLGAIGAALGVIAALGLTRFLRSALVGVSPTDAVSFAAALGIVLGSVLAATLIPAWRAARTSPLSALRLQ